jgi:signal transduction histidine kinase
VFRQIRSKLLAAFAVPLAILVTVAWLAISSTLSTTKSAQDKKEAVVLLALGLAGALLGLLMVIRVSRAVSRPLTDLANQAEHLATVSLPATVQAILDADATGGELPELPKVRVGNIEEVAGVASALEALNKTAVELASGQAALRRNLSDAFVNLGRRNQNLVTRQLEYITEIELKEADPTSLEELFRLDHLATRMRRNAESLLILAGSGPARQWTASVPVMDVARAASAEVEDYKRLRLHHFDPAMVTGVVTTDLVHILAELIENALSFSPPAAPVDVYGRFLEGGYVIVIVDSGIGMSSEDLATANQRLEGLGADAEVPGRYLGHFVAGRLAARHGIAISLQPSHSGGLVARVKVPSHLLEEVVADLSAGAEVKAAPSLSPALMDVDEPALPASLVPSPVTDPSPVAGPSPAIGTGLGLTAGLTADLTSGLVGATSPDDGTEDVGPAPVTNGSSAFGAVDDHDGTATAVDYEPVYDSGSSLDHDLDVEGTEFVDDGLGAGTGNGVTDLGSAWLSQVAEQPQENLDASYEPNGAAPDVEGDDSHFIKPFDWASPVEPGAPIASTDADDPENVLVDGGFSLAEGLSEPADLASDYQPDYQPDHQPDDQPGYQPASDGDDLEDATTAAGYAKNSSFFAPAGPDGALEDGLPGTGDAFAGHSWDAAPADSSIDSFEPEAAPVAVAGTAPVLFDQMAVADIDHSYSRTPDLGATSSLAGSPKDGGGNHFRAEPGSLGAASRPGPSLVEAAYVAASGHAGAQASSRATEVTSSSAASWNAGTSSFVAPAVGPAAQARSTADALRKLTRRVPGASLPEEDDSLRRPTTMSTTRNPLGLTGALSQYLSVTVEGRPEKEHNAR